MKRKQLKDLDLLDNFLFGKMMTSAEFKEDFARTILEIVLKRSFSSLKVVPQKTIFGADTGLHGARLDVYLEEDTSTENAAVLDMEPEKDSRQKSVTALPKRVRYYHSLIDNGILESGEGYQALRPVYVIMFLPFDPFGMNHMVYTIRNHCIELPDLPYEDGATTIFLYTKGEKGIPSEELAQLLRYMESTKSENAVNDTLRRLDDMVSHIKSKKEVSLEYMKSWEYEQMIREIAEEEGLAAGMAKGMAKGMADGMAKGMADGMAKGMAAGEARIIRAMLDSGMSVGQIAGILKMAPDEIEELLSLAKTV